MLNVVRPEARFTTREEKERAIGEALIASPIDFEVVATNLQRLRSETFSNRDERVLANPGILTRAMLASCAVPTLFPPIDIGEFQYVDGEIHLTNPFETAVKKQCDTIIFFYTPISRANERKRYDTMFGINLRIIEMNIYQCQDPQTLMNEALLEHGHEGQKARLIVIRPDLDRPLPSTSLKIRMTLKKSQIRIMINEGERCAREALQRNNVLIP